MVTVPSRILAPSHLGGELVWDQFASNSTNAARDVGKDEASRLRYFRPKAPQSPVGLDVPDIRVDDEYQIGSAGRLTVADVKVDNVSKIRMRVKLDQEGQPGSQYNFTPNPGSTVREGSETGTAIWSPRLGLSKSPFHGGDPYSEGTHLYTWSGLRT